MAFLAQLRTAADTRLKQVHDKVIEECKEKCKAVAANSLVAAHACFVNPLHADWEKEPDDIKKQLQETSAATIKRMLESLGLADVTVKYTISKQGPLWAPKPDFAGFDVSMCWSGTPSPGESDFVGSLNATATKARAEKHDALCKRIMNAFKKECMAKASNGIMAASLTVYSEYSDYLILQANPDHQSKLMRFESLEWEIWRASTNELMQRLKVEATQLGFRDVKVETAIGFCLRLSYKDTPSDNEVQISGSRTREERDAELRKRAVDVEGGSSSSLSPHTEPKRAKAE